MFPKRICKRNYIPHKTPINPNYKRWKYAYEEHLINMYNLFAHSINEKFENKVDWNDKNIFEKFCKYIFSISSKHILRDNYRGINSDSECRSAGTPTECPPEAGVWGLNPTSDSETD